MDQNFSIETMHMVVGIMKMLRPHRVEGGRKTRVGRFYDGGYVMLDKFDGIDAAYSLGINDDVSWDLDIAARGIPIFQYDHTIEGLPAQHPLFTWRKVGIDSDPDPGRLMETIPGILRSNGHEACDNLLLKCDIEGAEWRVLAGLPLRVLRQFKQIVIEVHSLQDLWAMGFANVVLRAVRNLSQTHRVIHVHGNNFARWTVVGGVPLPAVLELSFVRLDQGSFTVSDEIFPTPLDMPCHSKESDMFLGRFEFELPDVVAAPQAGAGRGAAGPSDAAVRAALLLLCADDAAAASQQDQIDCAELLLAAGHADAANLLRHAMSLPLGFAQQPGRDGAAGSAPSDAASGQAAPPTPGSTVDIAISQLRQVLASTQGAKPLPRHGRDAAADMRLYARADGEAGEGRALPLRAALDELPGLCGRLRTALRRPFDAQVREELDAVLARLRTDVLDRPAFDARQNVDAELSVLGAGIAFGRLRSFLARISDLAYGPFGSAEVFHAAARLDAAGLGPWFVNAPHVARRARDIFGLLQLASGKEPDGKLDDEFLERWAFLLSQHMSGTLLHDLVDELADLGLLRAIWGIFARTARRPPPGSDPDVLRCIRDAGLDHGDLELALRAQRLLARSNPNTSAEWIALGEVEATAGNRGEAEDALAFGLDLDPGNKHGRARLDALRAGSFDAVRVHGGFGSSPSRTLVRRRQAGLAEPVAGE